MAPVLDNRETLRKKKVVFGLSALDDPKWKLVDQKIKNLLRRREKTGGGKRETGAKWLLRGPQGACLAAIIPGDSAAEAVLTSGVISFINLYNLVLVVRVLLTWFPQAPSAIVGPVSTLADPYLNLFRGIIPPIGGTIDLSPVLAFLAINVFSNAAEAMPCDLQEAEARAAGAGRRRRFGLGGRAAPKRQQPRAEAEGEIGWRKLAMASRMNPVLLLEGFKQRRDQKNAGIA